MTGRKRILMIGAAIAAGILAVVAVGFVLLNHGSQESSVTASVQPSSSPSLEDPAVEVELAYLKFWEVWAQANLELKPALLHQVATGEALEALEDQVVTQKDMDQPVRIEVEHHYEMLLTTPDSASVEDTYINRSVRLSPETMQPIEPVPDARVRKSHTLRKVDGIWKVAEIIEYR